jgi:hypothetical protein
MAIGRATKAAATIVCARSADGSKMVATKGCQLDVVVVRMWLQLYVGQLGNAWMERLSLTAGARRAEAYSQQQTMFAMLF